MLVAALALVTTGCGGGEDTADVDAAIDLTVTVLPDGAAGDSISWRLTCEPTGGDHPDSEAACAALTAVPDPFGPLPEPDRCAEIPGGEDDVAVIDGDFRDRAVRSEFTHENACVAPRWDRIAPVFPTGF
ncbi:MAG: SSI family serine proteinase inhibitor [Actinomycetota bacterium]|nr:SSI family serine proteinase inhibitor [Actinomycetota bacterium]